MSVVPTRAAPDMKQVALGALVEIIGILVALLPGVLADGEVRLVMPWAAIGGVLVVIGSAISVKAILGARRTSI